jgi:hypothetical protein
VVSSLISQECLKTPPIAVELIWVTDKTASMTGAIVSYSTRARDSRFTGKLLLPAGLLDRRQWITRWGTALHTLRKRPSGVI